MAWLAVNLDGSEVLFDNINKPEKRPHGSWTNYYDRVYLSKDSIKRLIGCELTWYNEPVEFTEEVMNKVAPLV